MASAALVGLLSIAREIGAPSHIPLRIGGSSDAPIADPYEADKYPAFIARSKYRQAIDWPPRSRTVASTKEVRMSDCLHCDIHEMLESRLQREQADLTEIAAKVTEVLVDLILMAPPDEQCMMLADVVANLGGMVLEKSQEADPDSPRRSRH
jgi:hypothetical protein